MAAPATKTETRGAGLWTADQFVEFYMGRPDEERWQLVDGLAMMMVPPDVDHHKISKRFARLLDDALETSHPGWEAFEEMGVRIPGVDDFNPEPDVVVVPVDRISGRYATIFYLAAEVVSPSNTAEMIARNIELYQRHPDNLYCLTIDQDEVRVRAWAREEDWTMRELTSLEDILRLPAFGFEARVADIYRGTKLTD
ncbi:Uma2 family endonuclease [Afifella pfennigii]|uniref:Uma2 family endonuclease n=1 Tax=Afifella pfennigii TaxID=209897 RepID=UPI0006916E6D|nr:Uma2 family endonuclease [Afifella pfennigii]